MKSKGLCVSLIWLAFATTNACCQTEQCVGFSDLPLTQSESRAFFAMEPFGIVPEHATATSFTIDVEVTSVEHMEGARMRLFVFHPFQDGTIADDIEPYIGHQSFDAPLELLDQGFIDFSMSISDGTATFGSWGYEACFVPVPEPAASTMLPLGYVVMLLLRRRQRREASSRHVR